MNLQLDVSFAKFQRARIRVTGKLEFKLVLQGLEDPEDVLSLQVIIHKRAVQSFAFWRKTTCN